MLRGINMKRYKYVIFDLDGTLLDTAQDLADSVNFALEKAGLPLRSLDEIKLFVGNGVENLVRRAVGQDPTEPEFLKVLSDFKQHYAHNIANKTAPFPGVCDLLQQLRRRGIDVAVASNKYQHGVEELCELYFPGLYTIALGEREGVLRKPDPSVVFTAIEEMQGSRPDTVYIGDSEVDGETAHNAGVDFIGVSWGLRPVHMLHESGALEVVDKADQLLKFFI